MLRLKKTKSVSIVFGYPPCKHCLLYQSITADKYTNFTFDTDIGNISNQTLLALVIL